MAIPLAKQLHATLSPEIGGTDNSRTQTVFLVGDHPVVSRGITRLLRFAADFKVCGSAREFGPALDQIAELRPDLIILDLNLKGLGGLEFLKEVLARHPGQKVLALATIEEQIDASRAIELGASGYVMKHEQTEVIVSAIRQVLSGQIYLNQEPGKAIRQQLSATAALLGPLSQLTLRELEVFRLLGQGKKTSEIADELGLSPKTVGTHKTKTKDKLGLKSLSELVQYAIKLQANPAGPIG